MTDLPRHSPEYYYPKRIILASFAVNPLDKIFLCACEKCHRHFRTEYPNQDRPSQYREIEHQLQDEYLLMYALLIAQGRPTLIRRFMLENVKLHCGRFLRHSDLEFLSDIGDEAKCLQDGILREQYQFNVKPLVASQNVINYEGHEAVPIEDIEFLGKGSFGSVYKCLIPEYQGAEIENQKTFFARKVFSRRDFVFAHKEWEIHLRINQKNHDRLMSAVGAFIHENYFSIIFLCAESTLEEQLNAHFQGFNWTATREKSMHIWKECLEVARTLKFLREKNGMVHSDIKPQNLLLHDGKLKIADLGCSLLIESQTEASENVDIRAGGIYSPPEDRPDEFSYDVWSLGATFSEVATAELQGRDGLNDYRIERKQEDCQDLGFESACFHKGKIMKQSVGQRHKDLHKRVAKSKNGEDEKLSAWQERFYNQDFFNFIEKMMLGTKDKRPGISEVVFWLKGHIDEVSGFDEVDEISDEPEIYRRLRENIVPMDSEIHDTSLRATFIGGPDSAKKECVIFYDNPTRLIKVYYMVGHGRHGMREFQAYRRKSTATRDDSERGITGFLPFLENPRAMKLMSVNGRKQDYFFRSQKDMFRVLSALTGLFVHKERQNPVRVSDARIQIWTDRPVKPRCLHESSFTHLIKMMMAINTPQRFFVIYVSHHTNIQMISTGLRLSKVLIREIDLRDLVDINICEPYGYWASHATQQVDLQFCDQDSRDNLLKEFDMVHKEWICSREYFIGYHE
ncbi:kinase-like protein [Lepidopterella palustris CBS 459.81]|uniref:non-specific serine/threonine protein kinase n=1 Tax=Lepidopterella palustris CBS 459.81 TaxID=1314670 RepID=A0A8E2EBV5_9PEZI|nr:kinase-like protein [Lepidopterella palustris CBS 459.81]